jgi:pyridoxamine 5'-phosphate oxidase-like protein
VTTLEPTRPGSQESDGMTSTLPQEVRDTFDRFITCELTTVASNRQPITWPVTPYYDDGSATIDVTTGLGYPKKADDAQAHPSVALLFSDPTGSGVDSGIRVLVQGTASIDDTDLKANADRYVRESGEKLPATKKMQPPKPIRPLFNWYYARIYIKVRPERVFVWPDGDLARSPAIHGSHVEEVRSGHSEEPNTEHGGVAHGSAVWDQRMGFLNEHSSGVLSWLGPDGFPIAVRVPYTADPARREIRIEAEPAALPLLEGRACLTVHAHAPDFTWQRNMQVRGNLVRSPEGLKLVPRRIVGGFELPKGVGRFRDFVKKGPGFYRTYRRRLRERN